jgi:hypothetical protein
MEKNGVSMDVEEFTKAIGLPVSVTEKKEDRVRMITVTLKFGASLSISDRELFQSEVDISKVLARQFRESLLSEIFTLLKENDSRDLKHAIDMARRDGYMSTVRPYEHYLETAR